MVEITTGTHVMLHSLCMKGEDTKTFGRRPAGRNLPSPGLDCCRAAVTVVDVSLF